MSSAERDAIKLILSKWSINILKVIIICCITAGLLTVLAYFMIIPIFNEFVDNHFTVLLLSEFLVMFASVALREHLKAFIIGDAMVYLIHEINSISEHSDDEID